MTSREKWGDLPSSHVTTLLELPTVSTGVIVAMQFVVSLLVLVLLRPHFVLEQKTVNALPSLTPWRAVGVSVALCALALWMPALSAQVRGAA